MAATAQTQRSLDHLLAWNDSAGVQLKHVSVRQIEGKGFGIVADIDIEASEDDDEVTELVRVPADQVLSKAAVVKYAKLDDNFGRLVQVVGAESPRLLIMLYLLVHMMSGKHAPGNYRHCIGTSWTEYIKYLPRDVAVPTLWTEPHRLLLQGTSIPYALEGRINRLNVEFEKIAHRGQQLEFWKNFWGGNNGATESEWLMVDAWYKSRCMELPGHGHCMVPVVDMANHSCSKTRARTEEASNGDVLLRAKAGTRVAAGEEVYISYGDERPADEMLFCYGFIDEDSAMRLTLPLYDSEDDPLAVLKRRAFGGADTTISFRLLKGKGDEEGHAKPRVLWEGAFVWLMCVNEEDGLKFQTFEDDNGKTQLRTYWQGQDVTKEAGSFARLLENDERRALFELRAVAMVQDLAVELLNDMRVAPISDDGVLESLMAAGVTEGKYVELGKKLRDSQRPILEAVMVELEEEKSRLVEEKSVVAYFQSISERQG